MRLSFGVMMAAAGMLGWNRHTDNHWYKAKQPLPDDVQRMKIERALAKRVRKDRVRVENARRCAAGYYFNK